MEDQPRINWLVATVATLGGVLFILVGALGSYQSWWRDLWTSVLIDVGVGIALVAIIVSIERVLIAAVEQRVTASQANLSDRIDELETNLADLNKRIDEVREERYRSQDQAIQILRSEVTRESVIRAMLAAEELNAIHEPVYAQASSDNRGLRLGIRTGYYKMTGESYLSINVYHPIDGFFKVPVRELGGHPHESHITWEKRYATEQFIDKIVHELQRHAYFRPGSIDTGTYFANLMNTLDIAVRRRRRDDPTAPAFQGRLVECFDGSWFLTDAGIECPARGFVQPLDSSMRSRPEQPSFASKDEWEFLLTLAIDILDPPYPPIDGAARSRRL